MMAKSEDNRYKTRTEMGWGNKRNFFRGREKRGYLRRNSENQTLFRGRSVLAPSASEDVSQDNINDMDNRILSISDEYVSWQCFTVKNPSPVQSQTCAVIAEIQGSMRYDGGNRGKWTSARCFSVAELCKYGYSRDMKPYHSQAYKVHTAISCSQYTAEGTVTDLWEGLSFYHMEVSQKNEQWAFVSPVFFE